MKSLLRFLPPRFRHPRNISLVFPPTQPYPHTPTPASAVHPSTPIYNHASFPFAPVPVFPDPQLLPPETPTYDRLPITMTYAQVGYSSYAPLPEYLRVMGPECTIMYFHPQDLIDSYFDPSTQNPLPPHLELHPENNPRYYTQGSLGILHHQPPDSNAPNPRSDRPYHSETRIVATTRCPRGSVLLPHF
jgi:hypothetical protein